MLIKLLKQFDLLLTMLIALLNILWMVYQGHIKEIGLILVLPLIFLLPGYTFVEMLFHRRPIDGVHRVILSFGLSIALDILGGLMINLFPIGLTRISWSLYLGSLTIFLALVALCVRGKTSLNGLWIAQIRLDVRKHLVAELFIAAACGIAIFSFLFSDYSALHQHRPGFTQLWIIQADQPGKSCSVLIGVDNFEFTLVRYRIIMTINNVHPTLLSSIILHPQKTWKAIVPINSYANNGAVVNVQLYRVDEPTLVYRNVHLALQRMAGGKSGAQCTT